MSRRKREGIRDYSSPKKYGPIYGPVGSPFVVGDTCIWTNFAGVWSHTYVRSRGAAHILYKVSPIVPSPSRQIAWIPVRGRRVNISPHVKPRAGKNVSTWVPCLVLPAPFAPFLPANLSPSFSPLSIYLPSRAAAFTRRGGGGEGERRRNERGNVAERDGWTVPCFCAVFKSGECRDHSARS